MLVEPAQTFARKRSSRPDTFAIRAGVIDIGSNSIRLVVYEGARRAPVPIFNEKVMCGMGARLRSTGRLDENGVEMALANLPRFVAVADAMNVEELHVVATSAVRDAEDGAEFAERVGEVCGLPVRVVSGEEEARISGLGVASGHPDADGIVGDLGGGSLELIRLRHGQLDEHLTLPLGPLRLKEIAEGRDSLEAEIDAALGPVTWVDYARDRAFYAVGGAWRTLARIHLAQIRHRLHVIDGYTVDAGNFANFAKLVSRQHPERLTALPNVSSKRLQTLPIAALIMWRLLKLSRPRDVVFSATGLREGLLYAALPPRMRDEDPLIAASGHYCKRFSRFLGVGDALFDWTGPLFQGQDPWLSRLRHAGCLLADIGWSEHPDYRAKHTFRRVAALPLSGLDHAGRAFIARAIYARYSGDSRWADKRAAGLGLPPERVDQASILGAALRLGFTLCAGQRGVLKASELRMGRDELSLIVPNWAELAGGDEVRSRFETLARAVGRRPNLVRAAGAEE